MKTVLVLLVLFCGSLGVPKLPSDFKICKGENPNECLSGAIQDALQKLHNGYPDLKLPALEPLLIESATVGEGTGAVHVVQKYKNFQIYGISTAKIPKVEATTHTNGINLIIDAFIAETKIVADYDFNGRILLLPIVGNGKCQVILNDVKVKVKFLLEKYEKKGIAYARVKELTLELFPGKVTYQFDNLFNGDKRLGDEMNKVLNDNWDGVFNDIKTGYENLVGTVCTNYANQVFNNLPYDDVF